MARPSFETLKAIALKQAGMSDPQERPDINWDRVVSGLGVIRRCRDELLAARRQARDPGPFLVSEDEARDLREWAKAHCDREVMGEDPAMLLGRRVEKRAT